MSKPLESLTPAQLAQEILQDYRRGSGWWAWHVLDNHLSPSLIAALQRAGGGQLLAEYKASYEI